MHISNDQNKQLILNWRQTEMFNARFNDLFENRFLQVFHPRNKLYPIQNQFNNYEIVKTWRLLYPTFENRLTTEESTKPKYLDFLYHETPLEIRKIYLDLFYQLRPVHYVRNAVNEFASNFDKETDAIAVRTWSYSSHRQKHFSLSRTTKAIADMNCSKCFITCDSPHVLEKLLQKFGTKLIHFPSRTFHGDRNSLEGIQDAFIEMLLLARCRNLTGSYMSTFPEVAWWFGGCKSEVTII